ncbi:hypothetical protein SteCoe_6952 [Stentor coeruleus]|uniref:Uncharacterized protein n=1 Tax=Stentor coeruleus TaxID=5963 RepID=A0A1R2CNW6_9CILI|nr:hypothetical protein SteCoe_6952 [Stentor coeruleus]
MQSKIGTAEKTDDVVCAFNSLLEDLKTQSSILSNLKNQSPDNPDKLIELDSLLDSFLSDLILSISHLQKSIKFYEEKQAYLSNKLNNLFDFLQRDPISRNLLLYKLKIKKAMELNLMSLKSAFHWKMKEMLAKGVDIDKIFRRKQKTEYLQSLNMRTNELEIEIQKLENHKQKLIEGSDDSIDELEIISFLNKIILFSYS